MKNMKFNVGSFATAKLQAKMRSILAIIAIVAVIGFSMVSCKDDEEDKKGTEYTFKNQSSFAIQVDIDTAYKNNWNPNSFSVPASTEKTMVNKVQTYEESNFTFSWKRTDTNDKTGVIFEPHYGFGIFKNQ